jgi:apolipoprotein N-acyltransferase
VINFIQDLTLLCIMFSGVLRKRNSTRLWNMLFIQALWWVLAWIVTEVPSIVRRFPFGVISYAQQGVAQIMSFRGVDGMSLSAEGMHGNID